LAALWMVLDILRCETPLAHSWGALAYTQWRDVALLQTVSVVGQHGLTFVCVWFAASLALWLRAAQAGQSSAILWRAPLLVMIALHLWGMARIGRVAGRNGEKPQTLRVLLVQTTTGNGRTSFLQAHDMTFRAARQEQFDLIVWPETAFQVRRRKVLANAASTDLFEIGRDVEGLEVRQLDELARLTRTPILTGADISIEGGARSNQALVFEGAGRVASRVKNHLVPFGERAPWSETLTFLRALAPTPEMEAGSGTEPIVLRNRVLDDVAIGTLICFESCFQQPSRGLRRNGARALFVLTNDDLFRGSEAPWQHAAMSAVRAVENGVPVAQSANGGYTFAVDRWGRFMVKSTFNVPQTVQASLVLD
jgi:apolipoprotein N-acyltransferase